MNVGFRDILLYPISVICFRSVAICHCDFRLKSCLNFSKKNISITLHTDKQIKYPKEKNAKVPDVDETDECEEINKSNHFFP